MREQNPTPTPSPAGEPEMPALPKPFRAQGQQISYDDWDKAFCHMFCIEQMHAYARTYGQAMAEHARRVALQDARELLSAASTYANGYAQDEASDFGPDYTGCSQEQHEDAKRLFSAIRALAGKEGQG